MQAEWRRDIIVIGGSAGGMRALRELLDFLPPNFPGTIFVTIHVAADFPSVMPELLSKNGRAVRHPSNDEEFGPGQIFVAPPDKHLIIKPSRILLGSGPHENRHRPAIDVMFRSAARAYGPRVAAIVLSGQLDDGSAGLMAVKMARGLTIVQDPSEALAPDMPRNAIRYAEPDFVLPLQQIAELLISLSAHDRALPEVRGKLIQGESKEAKVEPYADDEEEATGTKKPSAFACPDCHGVLWEIEQGELLRYRCRVGHAYTADTLRVSLSESAENSLWVALRAVEEKAALLRRVAQKAGPRMNARYEQEAAGFDVHAATLRKMLAENRELIEGELGSSPAREFHA